MHLQLCSKVKISQVLLPFFLAWVECKEGNKKLSWKDGSRDHFQPMQASPQKCSSPWMWSAPTQVPVIKHLTLLPYQLQELSNGRVMRWRDHFEALQSQGIPAAWSSIPAACDQAHYKLKRQPNRAWPESAVILWKVPPKTILSTCSMPPHTHTQKKALYLTEGWNQWTSWTWD